MSSDPSDSRGTARRKRGPKATAAGAARFIDVTEQKRLNEAREAGIPWKKWGPYLSERQWGTVREDYSQDGNAWAYFTHDQSRSRAYRWGEDGLGGISDDKQRLCFALALWNENDPILKERAFGLTNSEGNHGEDVKEYYFYLDSTPTHSYMKYLYKYPQREFPYRDLIETNGRRSRQDFEYELIDTGIFDDNRYFDVFLEYAKAGPDDILIQVTVHNRGPEVARLQLLPTLWFRNTWSWKTGTPKPSLREVDGDDPCLAPGVRRLHAVLRRCRHRRAGTPLHGEREQRPTPVGAAERFSLGQGRVPPVRRSRGERGCQPGEDRHQGGRPLRPRRAGRRLRGRPPAPVCRRNGSGSPVRRQLRCDVRRAPRRRRRVLPADHGSIVERGRATGAPAGARRHALGETVLPLRCGHLAQGARRAPAPRRLEEGAERRVVPHVQRRHHLHARQVGVSLVRGLGPGVPHHFARARRFRLRQGAASADAAQPLFPPERPDPGLRVELQRREPAGPRLGHALPLQGRAAPGTRGHRVPGALV